MIDQLKENTLIKDSNGNSYYFYLENNTVKFERYSNYQALVGINTLTEDNILSYSSDIDKNDRIHVLCLTNEGKLIYYMYVNESWSNNVIAKLDIKSNNYNNLLFKINNENLHIMYAYSNLINSSVWTIQHIMGVKNKWDKKNVISVTTGKSAPYFNIDFDRFENVHMVYKAKSNGEDHIYYTSFNFPLKKWNKYPKQISEPCTNNISPYLFVDSKDNVHLSWCTSSNDDSYLSYKHLSSYGNNKFKWKPETLPVYSSNISTPIIHEEKGMINILYNNNNLISVIYSTDSGFTWNANTTQSYKRRGSLKTIKYSSNYQAENSMFRVNDLFINVENSFIQLPYKLLNDSQNNEMENHNIIYESKKQVQELNTSCDRETNFILNNLDEFEDEVIKDFVTKTKSSIELIFNQEKKIREIKAKIEKMILNNSINMDKKISHYNDYYKEVIHLLESLEDILKQCKKENDDILNIIDSIKEISLNKENSILLISSKLDEVKEIIRLESNKSIFKKILNIFRKDT